jgi:hypothetical protein
VTASIRSIHSLDSRRRALEIEEPSPLPVVLPEPQEVPPPPEQRATRESGPKHRRPSRFQRRWRPERPSPSQPATTPADPVPQQSPDITRTILELTDERFQELSFRLDRLSDEVAGLSRALDEREGEIDRSRWMLGDKLSALIERLDYD